MPEAKNDEVHGSAAGIIDPAVGLEPAQGLDDALFNRQLGTPAGGLNFFGIEENEGIVADPAAVTSGILKLWFQPKRGAEVADAIVHLYVFCCAQIIDLGVVLSDAAWGGLNELQRFALVKLAQSGHEHRNLPLALAEFGLTSGLPSP